MPDHVSTGRDGAVATIVLDHSARRNALSTDLMTELTAALRAVGEDAGVRAVVLGAVGPAFSAGHDLRELTGTGPEAHERVFAACAELMLTVHGIPQPVVARVQGVATAAGCQLVAACDLAVAADTATFATPGVRIGLFCSTPAVEVVRAVGRKRAMELLLTGEPIDAPTALEWGLVNRVVPAAELDDAARALAEQVAEASGATLAAGKRAFWAGVDLPLAAAYDVASAAMCANALEPDAQEGMSAFLEKRTATWRS